MALSRLTPLSDPPSPVAPPCTRASLTTRVSPVTVCSDSSCGTDPASPAEAPPRLLVPTATRGEDQCNVFLLYLVCVLFCCWSFTHGDSFPLWRCIYFIVLWKVFKENPSCKCDLYSFWSYCCWVKRLYCDRGHTRTRTPANACNFGKQCSMSSRHNKELPNCTDCKYNVQTKGLFTSAFDETQQYLQKRCNLFKKIIVCLCFVRDLLWWTFEVKK